MYEIFFYGSCAVVAVGIIVHWWFGHAWRLSGTVGEVRDYRYAWGALWRREAPRLIVRERVDGRGDVRIVFRGSSATLHTRCSPDEARRIARALREAASNPLPAPRP